MQKPIVSRIAKLRHQQGLTQRELAQAIGVSENTIANWESNRSGTDWFQKVDNLCRKLKCAPGDLYEFEQAPISKQADLTTTAEVLQEVDEGERSEPDIVELLKAKNRRLEGENESLRIEIKALKGEESGGRQSPLSFQGGIALSGAFRLVGHENWEQVFQGRMSACLEFLKETFGKEIPPSRLRSHVQKKGCETPYIKWPYRLTRTKYKDGREYVWILEVDR